MNCSEAATTSRPVYKRKVRNYLLDVGLQLRYTATIVVVAIFLTAGLGFKMYQATRDVSKVILWTSLVDPASADELQSQFANSDRVVLWGIPAAMIFSGTVLGKQPSFGWLTSATKLMGDSSYALYLIHPLVAAMIVRYWHDGLDRYPTIVVLACGLALSIVVSIAAFLLLEKKSTTFTRNVFGFRPTAPHMHS